MGKKIIDAMLKWGPVVGTAILTTVLDERKKSREMNEIKETIKKEILNELSKD